MRPEIPDVKIQPGNFALGNGASQQGREQYLGDLTTERALISSRKNANDLLFQGAGSFATAARQTAPTGPKNCAQIIACVEAVTMVFAGDKEGLRQHRRGFSCCCGPRGFNFRNEAAPLVSQKAMRHER